MKSPLRPVRITFVFGKGSVKRRRESQDPSRFIAEQLLSTVLNDNWEDFKADLSSQIRSDVAAELNHLASDFRFHVIGLTSRQNRPSGFLTTVAKGAGQPQMSLSAAYGQDWLSRSDKYLDWKKKTAGHTRWFDQGGYLRSKFRGEYLQGAATSAVGRGSGGEFGPAGGIFEELFGPVSVQILKNRVNWGLNAGAKIGNSFDARNPKLTAHLATVRVRALGSVTDAMLHVSPVYNAALTGLVKAKDPELAYRLGGRARYRPTLEPFLEFFLHKALPHAVSERIRKGSLGTSILRKA